MNSAKPLVNFEKYIQKVLKQIHPDLMISKNVKSQINSFINVFGGKIAEKASFLSNSSMAVRRTTKKENIENIEKNIKKNKQHTIMIKDIESSVAIIIGSNNQLYKHARSEGTKAVIKYSATPSGTKSKHISLTKRSGLVFSVSRSEKILRLTHCGRVSKKASIYFASILEYLTAEILELTGNKSKDMKRTTISSKSLMYSIRDDEELDLITLKINWRVLGGGTIPYIHKKLLPKEKQKKTRILKIKIIKHE